jgi:hypothetical protein
MIEFFFTTIIGSYTIESYNVVPHLKNITRIKSPAFTREKLHNHKHTITSSIMDQVEEEFKKQFDPNDPSYHNSTDKRPIVPFSGVNKVPNSMPSEFTETPSVQEPESYGPEYDAVYSLREALGELKKKILAVTPPIEATIRLQSNKPDSPQIAVEAQKLQEAIEALDQLRMKFDGTEFQTKVQVIDTIVQGAKVQFSSAEEFFPFATNCKKETQKVFNEQKQLLETLKKIKKEYSENK